MSDERLVLLRDMVQGLLKADVDPGEIQAVVEDVLTNWEITEELGDSFADDDDTWPDARFPENDLLEDQSGDSDPDPDNWQDLL